MADYIDNLINSQIEDLVSHKGRTQEEMDALGISSSDKNLNSPTNVIKEQAIQRGYDDPSKYVVSSGYGGLMNDAIQKRADAQFFDSNSLKKMQEMNRIKELGSQYNKLGQRVGAMANVKLKELQAKRAAYQAQEQARSQAVSQIYSTAGMAAGMGL